MKRVLFLLIITLVAGSAVAQPKARRQQQAQAKKQQSSNGQGISQRARLMYPTALDMPEDVVWRRDIYRELDLNEEANAGLYYPVEPIDRQLNLFTYVFKLALNGYIPVYEYRLDGNESFTDSARVAMKKLLDNYHIYYQEQNGKLRVDNSDIPSAEVKKYYIKETAYFDQGNATFRRKILALCPVMLREDDFGGSAMQYPLFWVRYSDLEPFLSRQTVMTSSLNNAASMTADDYFTTGSYKGKIYKTTNALGRTLSQYAQNDSAMAREQKRIEAELQAFEKNVFGQREEPEDTASIAAANSKETAKGGTEEKKQPRAAARRNRTTTTKTAKASKPKRSSSSSGSPRVSVRRERH